MNHSSENTGSDSSDHDEDTLLILPKNKAHKAKFPPGCRVLFCGGEKPRDETTAAANTTVIVHYGVVKDVGIDLASTVRETVYKIQLQRQQQPEQEEQQQQPPSAEQEAKATAVVVMVKKEEELQFAPFTPLWLKQQQQSSSATSAATSSSDGSNKNTKNEQRQEGFILSLEQPMVKKENDQDGSQGKGEGTVVYTVQVLQENKTAICYSNVPIENLSFKSDKNKQTKKNYSPQKARKQDPPLPQNVSPMISSGQGPQEQVCPRPFFSPSAATTAAGSLENSTTATTVTPFLEDKNCLLYTSPSPRD